MITTQPKKGDLLIAEPSIINDFSFNRSVILLADHTDEGSIGFIINKKLKFTLKDIIKETSSKYKIYNGGPVEQDNLYFIHKIPDLIPNSIEISKGIFWGGDFDVVLELIKNNLIKPSDIRFFLGYSGWEPKQLEKELESNTWIILENSLEKSLIEKNSNAFWKEKMLELGGEYTIWSNAPEDPALN